MNPYPQKNSVLIMDNASIHHNEELIRVIENVGCKVVFLPPYSLNMGNETETSRNSFGLGI